MKGRRGRAKQHAFLYISEVPRDPVCQSSNCNRLSNHFCKLCNKSLCSQCFKMEKVEDVFVVSGGEHKICNDCFSEHKIMNKLVQQYNLKFGHISQFNLQLWIKDYNQKKTQLSQLYSELKRQEQFHNVEIDIENTHFNSSYHQFLIKTTEGQSFIDIKIAIKNVINAFLHYDLKITYKKELLYQAFYLLNYTDELGAFVMMKFLYDHIIPQQLYQEDEEFKRNLTTRILESVSQILQKNLEQIPKVKSLLNDKLSSWILSLFSFNFRFAISLHTLQQTFIHYSFESIVNTIIAIIILIYPHFKTINYDVDKNKVDGILFSQIIFSKFSQQLITAASTEDYFKLISNKKNLNNEIWGNDYQQTLEFYEQQNKQLKLEITNLTKECKIYQQNIEEIEKRYIDIEFESVILPFEDNSNLRQRIENLKAEKENLTNMISIKQETIKNLKQTEDWYQKEKERLIQGSNDENNNLELEEMERMFIQKELELSKRIQELENEKKQKKGQLEEYSSLLKEINKSLELKRQQEN